MISQIQSGVTGRESVNDCRFRSRISGAHRSPIRVESPSHVRCLVHRDAAKCPRDRALHECRWLKVSVTQLYTGIGI